MRKLPDFWSKTLSYTLGTFISIVLTFGTAFYLQRCEKKKTERTAALMIIHNLSYFCEGIDIQIENLSKKDSLNQIVWDDWATDKRLPGDTLRLFTNSLLSPYVSCEDNAAESVFSSNAETWTSIGNCKAVELIGKCFSAKHKIVQLCEDLEEEKSQLWYTYMKTMYYTDNPTQSVQEEVDRVFRSPEFRCFIRKQTVLYLPMLKVSLMAMQNQLESIKQLMHISDEELKQFGLYRHTEYVAEPTPSDDSE